VVASVLVSFLNAVFPIFFDGEMALEACRRVLASKME